MNEFPHRHLTSGFYFFFRTIVPCFNQEMVFSTSELHSYQTLNVTKKALINMHKGECFTYTHTHTHKILQLNQLSPLIICSQKKKMFYAKIYINNHATGFFNRLLVFGVCFMLCHNAF